MNKSTTMNHQYSPLAQSDKPSRRQQTDLEVCIHHVDSKTTLLLQPVTKMISQEQLREELRSVYSGLVMVENKCKDVDREERKLALRGNTNGRPGLSSKHWQALVALSKALLHKPHDFFLASQHPAAAPDLSKLAAKHLMPARLW